MSSYDLQDKVTDEVADYLFNLGFDYDDIPSGTGGFIERLIKIAEEHASAVVENSALEASEVE